MNNYLRPQSLLLFFAVVLTLVFLRLGFWQLNRAQQKHELETLIKMQSTLPVLSIDRLLSKTQSLRYRPVSIEGEYLKDQQILLDNQVSHGRVGYHLFSPLKITGQDLYVLVNRGWIPMGKTRADLPDFFTPSSPITIHGVVQFPNKPSVRFGKAVEKDFGEASVWVYLDLAHWSKMYHKPLQPFVVLLDPSEEHGYVREWPKFAGSSHVHIAYAIQWFVFALCTVIYYGHLTRKRRTS